MKRKRIAVFISGRGSNFKAILDEVKRGVINGEIVTVISDNVDAEGLQFAVESGIEYKVFLKQPDDSRQSYFERIISYLQECNTDLICLAGFMKILSKNIVDRYRNRILNIHPALLPSFPGENAQAQAVEHGVKFSGCTVHFIDEGVDSGPIVIQEVVPVLDDDTEHTLASRILEKEHRAYPLAVKLFCEDRLLVKGRKVTRI
ncbi:MAG: phosphoribosylglycinamide formyltransferase [Spirochaetota bacterium]|nr:MAG: phosphoribosylglycinamide formyltransferase [Spirochaetota bacterium]